MLKTWVECRLSGSILDLWEETRKNGFVDQELVKAYTVKNGKNPRLYALIAPLHMPLIKFCTDISVWFLVQERNNEENEETTQVSNQIQKPKNAFAFLMSNKSLKLELKNVRNKKHEMYNNLVNLLECKFPKSMIFEGEKLINALVECFWSIESNHERISSVFKSVHCKDLPLFFEHRDWAAQKKAKSVLKRDTLLKCVDDMYDILSFCDKKSTVSEKVLNDCRFLAESLRTYAEYLKKANQRVSDVRSSLENPLNETFTSPIEPVDQKKPM